MLCLCGVFCVCAFNGLYVLNARLLVRFFLLFVCQVKVATVKHLWEKVAAIRRAKAVGSEDLKVGG